MSSMTGSMGYGGGNKIPKGYEQGTLQQFTPEQMNLFKSMFGQVGPDSFLGKLAGGDQSMFEQMEAPAMRQFQGLQGQLASRFSGMGMGSRRGSGFQNRSRHVISINSVVGAAPRVLRPLCSGSDPGPAYDFRTRKVDRA